ncbi:hypothetical protein [Arthrobacter sp. KNU40]|uniref:hypothetical protein n=1 Tax=Arthrobacter sp. KNU40 TaxID=3447965 RepID=UPI003F5F2A0B
MEANQFETHPIWGKPDQVSDVLATLEPATNESQVAAFERLRFLTGLLASYKAVDSRLFTSEQLRQADEQWQNALNYLSNARSNPGQETQAVVYAEAWLQAAGSWHKPQSTSAKLAQQAKLEYETLIDSYRKANTGLKQKLAETEETSTKNQTALEERVQELGQTLAQAQQSLAAMQTTITSDQALMQQAITNHAENFRAAQENRGTEFTTWLKSQGQEFVKLAQPHLETIKGAEEESAGVLKRIQTLGDQTDVAAGQTTGHILAENFKTSANEELKSGNQAFWIGIGLSIAGVGWLVYVAIVAFWERGDFNWTWLSLKLALSLALGGVATILVRRGQHSQATSRAYKRTELELRAIGPYLSDIEDRKVAEEAKVAFLQKTFGRAWEDHSGAAQAENLDSDYVKKALDVVSTLADKLPKAG